MYKALFFLLVIAVLALSVAYADDDSVAYGHGGSYAARSHGGGYGGGDGYAGGHGGFHGRGY